ncbi:hypothetical protein VTN31DRAFT_3368 [Thermomyces dupontii]|uniref:uncharacterized protein n=1 Tax=Talaromyces thermophilus TaxID=28565 RepID=UPI0037441303
MVPFTNPFRWRIWPWLWVLITDFIRGINLFTAVKPSLHGDGCKENATSEKLKNSVMYVKVPKGHLTSGFSGIICKVDEETIVKYPKFIPNDDSRNRMFRDMISKEREIYERLGAHQGIISYLGIHDESTGAIKLEYAKQGDLERYIQTHETP